MAIASIEIGDYVLAWNEANGTLGYYKVANTIHHTDKMVVNLILDGEWIKTTPEHPFYVEGKGWVKAKDLEMGDEIRQADGTSGKVWLKWAIHTTQEMYNLSVDAAHTFFVGEGQWLVHNSWCPIVGRPQNISTEHQLLNWKYALEYGSSGRYDKVFLNREVKKATLSQVSSPTKPDVMGLNFKKKVADIVEIASPSQRPGRSGYQPFVSSIIKTTRAFVDAGWRVNVKIILSK
jgi:hypothetical protein